MQWSKLGVVLCSGILFAGCGTKDDEGGPATLKQAYYGEISPFDTLFVAFDQEIRKPADSSVDAKGNKVQVLSARGSELVLVGADTVLAGFPRFAPGVSSHMVSFKHVENANGDIQETDQVVNFSTLPFIDKDYTCESNLTNCLFDFSPEEGVVLTPTGNAFFNGAKLDAGVKVAGILMLTSGPKVTGQGTIVDNEDHYLIQLKQGDSIEVSLDGFRQPLDLVLLGAQDSEGSSDFGDFSLTVPAQGLTQPLTLRHKIGVEHSDAAGTRKPSDLATFALKVVFNERNPLGPTPYVLSVKLVSRKYN